MDSRREFRLGIRWAVPLSAHLLVGLLFLVTLTVPARAAPAWVVDPDEPGSTLPPVGRSLFDFVTTSPDESGRLVQRVPYPFSALTDFIGRHLGEEGQARVSLKQVLIPLGRSLQRMAAAPDFFRYPRAVVAVVGGPVPVEGQSGLLLRDRLFLGYQEKGGVIEVISYNEAAGRFEFQQVENYREGETPVVRYMDRETCLECHQNHAPIFATAEWDETNANPKIAALLRDGGANAHGIPLDPGLDVADAIDEATNRANGLSILQLLWRLGCGSGPEAIACRADAFLAVLQHGLSGGRRASPAASAYPGRYAASLAANWSKLWPDGLLRPNPDIPNRVHPVTAGMAPDKLEALVEPEGSFAASARRAGLPATSPREDFAASRVIHGFSGFLAGVDYRRLDRHLVDRRADRPAAGQVRQADCRIRRRDAGGRFMIRFDCEDDDSGFTVKGDAALRAGAVAGTINRLEVTGRDPLLNLRIAAGEISSKAGRTALALGLTERSLGLSARFSDGDGVAELVITWDGGLEAGAWDGASGRLVVAEDFAAVSEAVEAMVRDTLAGKTDVYSGRPFRRADLMKDLFGRLGMAGLRWCCLDDTGMPAALN